ncbi:MAG: MmgE/PrpD family protein [Acidobacteria bacterium]|nr:MmgE/PrpD family protein [Acidobacteriota bacterium]MBI3423497.1 MmgE/PrpD family protein [Acidobacteriota bacterium]
MSISETLLQRFSRFAADVTYDALPPAVITSIKERTLDTVGLCLAATPLETSQMALNLALSWGGHPEATTIGAPHRLPAPSAGFVNGTLAHSLDYDDTHLPSVLHPSASLIPGVLAVGEAINASGKDVIAAAAIGYELCVRAGMAAYDRTLGNSVFFERGWHATSICGTLGVAAAAAKLYGLGAEGVMHAVGIAASLGAGVIEANRTGGSVKRLHCGWAAHAGIIAAQTARAGFTGPPSILEGRFGFYQAFCGGQFDAAEIVDGLGENWCIPDIFYKPYPANHFTHAGIDAALRLRERIGNLDDIAEIELGVASPTLRTIAQPPEQKARPQSGYHAQFSGPFTVAAALLGGGGGLGLWLDDFTDANVSDPRYLALAAKVRCVANAECDAIFPNQFPAVLTIRLKSGEVLVEKVLANRGGPANPLSLAELKIKFAANAGRRLSATAAQAVADSIAHMEMHTPADWLGLTIANE